jgi:hypothetical protein
MKNIKDYILSWLYLMNHKNKWTNFIYGALVGIVGFLVVYIYIINLVDINFSLFAFLILLIYVIRQKYIENLGWVINDYSMLIINERTTEDNFNSVIEESIYKFRLSTFALSGNVSNELYIDDEAFLLMRRVLKNTKNDESYYLYGLGRIFNWFSLRPSSKMTKREYSSTSWFNPRNVQEKMVVTGKFKNEKQIGNEIVVDPLLIKHIERALAHPALFEFKFIDEENKILEFTLLTMTHTKGTVPSFITGTRVPTISIGEDKEGKNWYICSQAQRFYLKEKDIVCIMKGSVYNWEENGLLLTEAKKELIQEYINNGQIKALNHSKSEYEDMSGYKLGDLVQRNEKMQQIYEIANKIIDRD